MNRFRAWGALYLSFVVLGVMTASADPYTGNPVTDGWQFRGNSLTLGTYIRGTAGFSFSVYSEAFTLTTNSALENGIDWFAGDQIIGLGGVTAGEYIYEPRLVAKFGAVGSIFSASDAAHPSPNGNGNGSFSAGNGGLGSVQVDYAYEFKTSPTNELLAGQNNVILIPDEVLYYSNTGSTDTGNPFFGAVLGEFTRTNNVDFLKSWEVVLNLSDLSRSGYSNQMPVVYSPDDMALQQNQDIFTDAFANPVPEPSTVALAFLSAATLGWRLKRSRRIDASL